MNDTIQITVPIQLRHQIHTLVAEGWFLDENDLLLEALRRFLDAHRPEVMESLIRDDAEWGLRGEK
jgi:Arc/MetJ-type ribon-helix-helix transcriptional regulator